MTATCVSLRTARVELLLEPLVERAVVQDSGQRVLVDLASQILVELGVSDGQGGLRSDRAAEVDVALRPAARRGVVRHLDQADRPAVHDQRQLDPRAPAPLDQLLPDERRDPRIGHALDAETVGRAEQDARRRIVVEQVDVAAVVLRCALPADVDRCDLEDVAGRVPDVDRALADPVDGVYELTRKRIHHVREREGLREGDGDTMEHFQLAPVAAVGRFAGGHGIQLSAHM